MFAKSVTFLIAPMIALFARLGAQGTRAIAALVVIGVGFPSLGNILRPFVAEAIFLLLVISFMRVDAVALRNVSRRPGLIIAATGWTMLGVPLVMGGVGLAVGLDRTSPDLLLALVLQSVASPMMAAPALAGLMGLDTTLVLVTLVSGTVLVPFTAPLFAALFVDKTLALQPQDFGLQLFGILGGALLVAAFIRRFSNAETIARHKAAIDGFNILVLLVFVSAVMSGVAPATAIDPLGTLLLLLLAFAVFGLLLATTMALFWRTGAECALALGLMVCQRNMGLMVAAAGGALPAMAWLYFALSQFPIYLSPQLLAPVARWTSRDIKAGGPPS